MTKLSDNFTHAELYLYYTRNGAQSMADEVAREWTSTEQLQMLGYLQAAAAALLAIHIETIRTTTEPYAESSAAPLPLELIHDQERLDIRKLIPLLNNLAETLMMFRCDEEGQPVQWLAEQSGFSDRYITLLLRRLIQSGYLIRIPQATGPYSEYSMNALAAWEEI